MAEPITNTHIVTRWASAQYFGEARATYGCDGLEVNLTGMVEMVSALRGVRTPDSSATVVNLEAREPRVSLFDCGGPGVTRTPDKRFRKPLLYPPELRGHAVLERLGCRW
jgi:hypothetical protein